MQSMLKGRKFKSDERKCFSTQLAFGICYHMELLRPNISHVFEGRKGCLGIYMESRFSKEKGSNLNEGSEVQSRGFSFSLSD